MRMIDAPQRSPAWYDARLGVPTASNAAAITGRTKAGKHTAARTTYAYRLVAERLSGPQEQHVTPAMQRGIDQEPEALGHYALRTGNAVEVAPFCLHESGRFGASPDAFATSLDDGAGLVEVKTTAPHLFVELMLGADDAPLQKHAAQMTCQLVVTGAAWCDLALWCEPLGQLWTGRWEPTATERAAMEAAMLQFADEVDAMEAEVTERLAAMASLDEMPAAAGGR